MPLYSSVTAGEMVRDLARMLGDLQFDGAATAVAASTITSVAMPWNTDDNAGILGAWIYLISGLAAGDERKLVTTYTATTGVATVDRAWTNTTTATPSYIITRKYRPTYLLRALQEAQRYQTQRLLSLLPVTGREIVIGSVLLNNFDLFTTANVPDGLTVDANGTVTNEATVTAGGRRGLRVVTDGTNAWSVRFAAPRWGKWRGKTAKLRVLLRTSIASRTSIQINDGVSSTSDTAETNNRWEWLEVDRSIDEAATQVRFSVEVSSGAAVTVDMAWWYGEDPAGDSHEYPLDADRNLVGISDLWAGGQISDASSQQSYNYNESWFPPETYDIFEDVDNTPRLLRLRIGSEWNQRGLEYKGWQRQAEITGPTITWNGTPELILARAKYYMLRDTFSGEDEWRRMRLYESELKEIERREPNGLAVSLPLSFKRIMSQ